MLIYVYIAVNKCVVYVIHTLPFLYYVLKIVENCLGRILSLSIYACYQLFKKVPILFYE